MSVRIEASYEGELHTTARHGPSGATLETDAPKDNEGRGEAFSPTDLLATALGSCMLTVMGILARRKGWAMEGARVSVDKHMVTDPVRRIGRLDVHFEMPAGIPEAARKPLERAAHTCPVHQSLHPDTQLDLTFTWRPSRQLTGTLSQGIENADVSLLTSGSVEDLLRMTSDPRLRRLLLVPEGESTLVASALGASIDLRDNPFNPRKGFFLSVSAEWGRTLATQSLDLGDMSQELFSHHVRTTATVSCMSTALIPLAMSPMKSSSTSHGVRRSVTSMILRRNAPPRWWLTSMSEATTSASR